jgi:hypothetical protein
MAFPIAEANCVPLGAPFDAPDTVHKPPSDN